MVTGKADINVVSDDEDRGPLVEDVDFASAKASIEEKAESLGDSPEDVLAFLEADEDEETEESYYDSRVPIARDIRPVIAAWHEYKNAMAQVKTTYKLWKIEANELGGEGDQRRDAIVQNAARIKRALDVIEKELKEVFPKLKGAAFLTRSEIIVLPRWMHKLLGITIEASADERESAQADLQKQLDGANEAE
tara:strand:- start:723 stop:1301 length:579 start_codon:yes stop_codon:yes gene_type:complete